MTLEELVKRIMHDNSNTYLAQCLREAAARAACGVE